MRTFIRGDMPVAGDLVWSGAVGTLVGAAISGVLGLLANRQLAKQHRKQLEASQIEHDRQRAHEASESALERLQQLRREVYLPAASGVTAALQAVYRLSDPLVPRLEIRTDYSHAIAAIAQANAVGSAKTVRAVGDLMNFANRAFNELLVYRNVIEQAHSTFIAQSNMVDRAIKDQNEWVSRHSELLYAGPPQQSKLSYAQRQVDFFTQQFNHWSELRDQAYKDVIISQIEFFKALIDRQVGYRNVSSAANIALRVELGLLGAGDQAKVLAELKRSEDDANAALKSFVDAAERDLQGVHK